MSDIILFQPKCGIWDIMGVRAPTGLLAIGAVPVQKGYSVKLIDQRINQNWEKDLREEIDKGAKIVCLTSMAGDQINSVIGLSKLIKSINPKVMTVLGGAWAQIKPELCLQDKNIDVVCYGEGDYLLTDLMENNLENVLGIVYQKNGEIKRTDPRPMIQNLDDLPKIPYHLVNLKNYTAVGFRKGKPSISLVTSRGCQFRCSFCSIVTLFNRSWRGYSVKRLMEDLEELEMKYGIKDFYFNDDLMSGNHQRFIEFIETLANSDKDYYWGTAGMRGDYILRLTDEQMETLVKSGCKNLDIGVESGNERVLKLIQKDTTTEIIRKVNQKLSKYPIIIKYSFMGGFPTETEEEFKDTLRFRKILQEENEYATAPIFFYTPFPGTALFKQAIENGFKPPQSLQEWADFNYDTWYHKHPCWLTKSKINLVENAVFTSYFSNKKLVYKYPNPLLRAMFKLYYPIAKYRYDNNFYSLMIEKKMADLIAKLNDKVNLFNR